ncbi:hypothetical protein SAMN04488134_11540 [Amphibacillus marinus]|uniref:Uncharacterized protein n=1 Tax=Amphibacillus marinus TaxID=872970 RepID=A0A1H8TA55_9BACI|nr:hypothetical protein [Amphibacillus marinus]SEO87741.1 hypothetical protein SAMN04488134_11540 [Amphibacillus marinus]
MKRVIIVNIIVSFIIIACAIGYVLSLFFQLGILESMTVYGGWVLLAVNLGCFVNLLSASKKLSFFQKIKIRGLTSL